MIINLLVKKIFPEKSYLKDQGEDLNVVVAQLEKNKIDRTVTGQEEIKVPQPHRLSSQIFVGGKKEAVNFDTFKKGAVETSHGILKPEGSFNSGAIKSGAQHSDQSFGANKFSKEHFGAEAGLKKIEQKAKQSSDNHSIFEGDQGVSRLKLAHEMRYDSKIWKAQRQAGLTLTPGEREELVKEVFSSALGRNISKSDLKVSIKKLGRKLVDTKDPKQHEKIRKEIKFFKKIGGIQ